MPRKPYYWTRKLELELVEFVRHKEFIWRPLGNTNHHIQQKYKAYAEFASRSGRGFTARSVRDRWVNIRSTFNHNLRRVEKSKETAKSYEDIYIPCWPLWRPLQFLRESSKKDDTNCDNYPEPFREAELRDVSDTSKLKKEICRIGDNNYLEHSHQEELIDSTNILKLKDEACKDDNNYSKHRRDERDETQKLKLKEEIDDNVDISLRQHGYRTDRPHRKTRFNKKNKQKTKCKEVIDELILAMKPISGELSMDQPYWLFAKHVVTRLNSLREIDAQCAAQNILKLLENTNEDLT